MPTSSETLTESVRREAERMLGATSSAAPDAQVSMPASQFLKLAELMVQLCDALEERDARDEGRLGDTRYWVPLASYQRLKAELQKLEEHNTLQNLF